MKRNFFINKLIFEGIIKLILPSDDVSNSYLVKSNNSLKAAKLLFEQDLFEESVSMSYYSMFHITQSLFFKVGIKCENHNALIILLKELFKQDNKDISFAKKERIDKQYYIDFEITKNSCENMIKITENFNGDLYVFINELSLKDIEMFRTKFKEIYLTK
ncbi:MAG: HEPN domain-containing protein [Nanoarchaeota archaeon]